jgi:hypothetical protein
MTIMQRHGIGGVLTTNQQFANGGGEAVTITDADGWVCMTVTDKPLRLTPEQARYLSRCFADAAERVEAISASKETD